MTDEETGFYYLQSRYYNPEVGRFISADVLLSTGQGVLGHNAYAYCGNNPIVREDTQEQSLGIDCGGSRCGCRCCQ
ncbi:MAG: RHS repeat-associated core domain-containing protein [Christensenellales bacterium]